MTPDDVQTLRSMMLQGPGAVGSPEIDYRDQKGLDPRTASLIRVVVLLSVDSDAQGIRWAIDDGIAAGVEDSELVAAFKIMAPVLGTGRLTSALTKLLSGLEIDLFEESGPEAENVPSRTS
jgi:alkylhydroperoxidase/carboxymuconolactone decarboxylase family protein YurZ